MIVQKTVMRSRESLGINGTGIAWVLPQCVLTFENFLHLIHPKELHVEE